MGRYVLQMEDLWQGQWLAIGASASVEAASPSDAWALVKSVGLRPGVTYRVHICGPGVDLRTQPVQAPELPVLA